MNGRHLEADTSPVTVERSDAIDAVAGLRLLAEHSRRQSKSRRYRGAQHAGYRRDLRAAAMVYVEAARRVQHACDEATR